MKTAFLSSVRGHPSEDHAQRLLAEHYDELGTLAEGQAVAKEIAPIPHPINHTVTSLYYREPLDMKQIYSDRYGEMCAVQRVATGAYDVMMPDGKKTRYTYTEGQCREVKSQIAGLNLVFRIRPGSVAR